jgi:hypothetical protein
LKAQKIVVEEREVHLFGDARLAFALTGGRLLEPWLVTSFPLARILEDPSYIWILGLILAPSSRRNTIRLLAIRKKISVHLYSISNSDLQLLGIIYF